MLNSWDIESEALIANGDPDALDRLIAMKLAEKDWRTVVLLGDPTVRIYP